MADAAATQAAAASGRAGAMNMTEALAQALISPVPQPTTWGLVNAFGGRTSGTRALALLRIGRDPGDPLPAAGSPERRRYLNERRTIERWLNYERDLPAQRRKPNSGWLTEQVDRIRIQATRRRITSMRRIGARAWALVITHSSGEEERMRRIPGSGPGVFMTKDDMIAITDPFLAGKAVEAATQFERRFLANYLRSSGGDDAEIDIIDVDELSVEPDKPKQR